jgi:hypothetical protein
MASGDGFREAQYHAGCTCAVGATAAGHSFITVSDVPKGNDEMNERPLVIAGGKLLQLA